MKKDAQNTTKQGNEANTMLEPVFVGQILFRDSSSKFSPDEIKEYTVIKVAKKYFYINMGRENDYPINKETLKYEDKVYSQHDFKLYKSKQEILDKREREVLISKLKKHFDWSGNYNKNTLSQLKECSNILGIS